MASSTPSIAIIGAGPAGLTLAKLLLVSPIASTLNLTIYERDASPKSRSYQGGTLDLHPETGLLALKKCGLWDVALPYLRYEGEELFLADKNGFVYVHMVEEPQRDSTSKKGEDKKGVYGKWDQRPEIDREKLKEILLDGAGAERVSWGRKLQRVTNEGTLEFEDGKTEGPFDLIIGADGAFSKARHVLTDVRPRYSGICGVQGTIKHPKKDHPEVDKMEGRGSYFTFANEKSLMAQRMGDDSIKLGMWVKREKEWVDALFKEKGGDTEAIKRVLLDEFSEWVEEMRDWIRASTNLRQWILWELPVGHTWEHRKGYTLLGDAAHLCTPFAGLGVNTAMKDALELSELIIQSFSGNGPTLDQAVAKYEKGMFPRTEKVQRHTMKNKESMFRSDAPVSFFASMIGVVADEVGWPLDEGVLWFIPISRMFYAVMWVLGRFGAFKRWFNNTLWKRKRLQS